MGEYGFDGFFSQLLTMEACRSKKILASQQETGRGKIMFSLS